MQRKLRKDPTKLTRRQKLSTLERNDKTRLSPLHDAVACLHFNCVEFLLDSGAPIHEPGTPSLIYSLYEYSQILSEEHKPSSQFFILEILLQRDFLNNIPISSQPLLTPQVEIFRLKEIDLMLEYGALITDPQGNQQYERHLLQTAFLECNFGLVKLLLMYDAPLVFSRNIYGEFKENLPLTHRYESIVPIPIQLFRDFYDTFMRTSHKKGSNVSLFIKAILIYQSFGGDINETLLLQNGAKFYNLLQYVTALDALIPDHPFLKNSLVKIKCISSNPMELTRLCRLAIKLAMGRRYKSKYKTLKYTTGSNQTRFFPTNLYSFMEFND
jgi:hypothetical protein